jgi:hypothetical protein
LDGSTNVQIVLGFNLEMTEIVGDALIEKTLMTLLPAPGSIQSVERFADTYIK